MDVSLTEALTVYGPLGILALVSMLAAGHMFRVLIKEREKHNQQFEALTKDHRAEMKAMLDRHIETTTTQITRYHDLADKLHAVIDSIARRIDRKG